LHLDWNCELRRRSVLTDPLFLLLLHPCQLEVEGTTVFLPLELELGFGISCREEWTIVLRERCSEEE